MRLFTLALSLAVLQGCASNEPLPNNTARERLPFTDALAREWNLDPGYRPQVQYYVSDAIRLVRSVSGGEKGIADGILVSNGGRAIDEVVIESGTPGVLVGEGTLGNGQNWMAVSFQPGTHLYFISNAPQRGSRIGERYSADRYYLYIPDWNGRTGSAKLGEDSFAVAPESLAAHLIVTRESSFTNESAVYRQPGRYLGQ